MTPPNSTVLLCLCLFLSFGSNAQQQGIERLRKTIEIQLTQATSDTSRLRLLMALSKVQIDTLGDAAYTYLEQARKLAEKTGDYKTLHQVLVKMGDIKHVTNDFYSALKYYHYLLEILITNGLDGVGGVYNRISVIHILLQQYDSALRNIDGESITARKKAISCMKVSFNKHSVIFNCSNKNTVMHYKAILIHTSSFAMSGVNDV